MLSRPNIPDFIGTRDELFTRAEAVFAWVLRDGLTVPIGQRYALADAAGAHTDLEERRSVGKLLLIP
jgi:NADPH2:quinone reductase